MDLRDAKSPEISVNAEHDWIMRYIGLLPSGYLSSDSLLSEEEEDLGDKELDVEYSAYAAQTIPSLKAHLSEHDKVSDYFRPSCPWCNPPFFDWLITQKRYHFMSDPDGSFKIIEYTLNSKHQNNSSKDGRHDSRFRFKFFEKANDLEPKKPTRRVNKRKNREFYEDYLPGVRARADSTSVTEAAQGCKHNGFATHPKNQEQVEEKLVEAKFKLEAGDMTTWPMDNNLFVLPSSEFQTQQDVPKFLIMRFDNAIPAAISTSLWEHWCTFRDGLSYAKTNEHRDVLPQLHLGVWSHYCSEAYVTWDTKKQTGDVAANLNAFVRVVRHEVAYRVWNLLKRYDFDTLKRHVLANDTLNRDTRFLNLMKNNPRLDFGGMFYTLAVKEGGSQTIHLDWKDHPGSYSWVILVGPGWTGGELCFPQLGKKLPTRPGQVIAFRGRYLAHFAAANDGHRLAITGFTDETLMGRALNGLLGKPAKKRRRGVKKAKQFKKMAQKTEDPSEMAEQPAWKKRKVN